MIAELFDVFFLDLDGVVYISREPTYGAIEALDRLRKIGKSVRFLTNNPTGRNFIAQRLNRMGIEADEREIVTSGWATARFLAKKGVSKVWVLGDEPLKKEIEQAGISIVDQLPCDAVVTGWGDAITLRELRRAALAIRNGALFVATNVDKTFPSAYGPLAAVGAVVEALRVACGQNPVVIGKPYPPMFYEAMQTVSSDRVVMIGDSPEVDILGAHQAGISAILMGDHMPFPFEKDFRNADARIHSLIDLFNPQVLIKKWSLPSFPWPEKVEPGVAGIVFDDQGRVLLMRRADNELWGIPSGHVEPAERVDQAIVREILEETGLRVRVKRLIGVYSDPFSQIICYPNKCTSHFITICFECELIGGHIKRRGVETLDVNFFSPQELPSDLMPMHPQWLKDALIKSRNSFIR
ncbi:MULTISPECIES: HAD-IIA family hydrolase [Aminobacterium]|jgi:HAD superfamily hydrolase (TIGR01450 family)|uniref:HAD-IIA family hydrolase n=1 Tax=Aminobacterium TaxID=81466 RepID=UPI0004656CCA|nr:MULTISPECIES: HAD-IIA family hydrolase [Aminobacterium]